MQSICSFPCWPLAPAGPAGTMWSVLAVAGIIFSIVMLIDCLRRQASEFACPLTKDGVYDKLIWAGAILLSLSFYFAGAIVYFFVVKRGRPKDQQ